MNLFAAACSIEASLAVLFPESDFSVALYLSPEKDEPDTYFCESLIYFPDRDRTLEVEIPLCREDFRKYRYLEVITEAHLAAIECEQDSAVDALE